MRAGKSNAVAQSVDNDLSIDFETRSDLDLKTAGTVRYATHDRTHVMHAAIDWRGETFIFNPVVNRKNALDFITAIYESGDQFTAYAWAFEYCIMRYVCSRLYGWPIFTFDRFNCTRARALRYGLPGKLENDSAFLGTAAKDTEGGKIMMALTKPRRKRKEDTPGWLYYDQDQDKHLKCQQYCAQDVRAEQALARAVPILSKQENKIFRLDQRMNVDGIRVDLKLCHGALKIFSGYEKDLIKSVPKSAWKHFDTLGQLAKVKAYCNSLDPNLNLPNMQADTIERVLRTCTNKKVQRVLQAKNEISGQSVNKYKKVLDQQYDGRLQFNLHYCGARATGRWSGGGTQLHNMNRPNLAKEYYTDDEAIRVIQSGSYGALKEYATSIKNNKNKPATPADVLKSYMRGILLADRKHWLAVTDYASIEARLVFFFSGCDKGLQLYVDGKDPYVYLASIIYGVKEKHVTDDQRFVGKQGILGLGYGMGAVAFVAQCLKYGVHISPGLAYKTVNKYRSTFREIRKCWDAMENTVLFLVSSKTRRNKWAECGAVSYMFDGVNLYCRLQSGAILTYHRMTLDHDKLTYWTVPKKGGLTMVPRTIWGGTFFENVCQATNREIMSDAMLRTAAHDMPPQLTVHDELMNRLQREDQYSECEQLILTLPRWMDKNFPLAVEGRALKRYQKI